MTLSRMVKKNQNFSGVNHVSAYYIKRLLFDHRKCIINHQRKKQLLQYSECWLLDLNLRFIHVHVYWYFALPTFQLLVYPQVFFFRHSVFCLGCFAQFLIFLTTTNLFFYQMKFDYCMNQSTFNRAINNALKT